MRILSGLLSPVINEAFTKTPAGVYSEMKPVPELPVPLFTTKIFVPFDAAPWATLTPEMRALFTVAPAVVYSPMVLVGFPFATKMFEPKEVI